MKSADRGCALHHDSHRILSRSASGVGAFVLLLLTFMAVPLRADICEAFSFAEQPKLDDQGGKLKLQVPDGMHFLGRYNSPAFGLMEYQTEVRGGKRGDDFLIRKGRPMRVTERPAPRPEAEQCLRESQPVKQVSKIEQAGEWLLSSAWDLVAGQPAYARSRPPSCKMMVVVRCYGEPDNPGRTCVAEHWCGNTYMGYLDLCTGNECPTAPKPGPKGGGNKPKT